MSDLQPAGPSPAPPPWVTDLVRKVTLLRTSGKKAIIWIDPDLPVVLVFEQGQAGRVVVR